MQVVFTFLLLLSSFLGAADSDVIDEDIQATKDSIQEWESKLVANPTSSVDKKYNERIQEQIDGLNKKLLNLNAEKSKYESQHRYDVPSSSNNPTTTTTPLSHPQI